MMKRYGFVIPVTFLFAAVSVTLAQAPVMSVKITSPASGTHFAKCSEILVTVDTQIQGGEIKNVSLYRNGINITAKSKAPWEMKLKNQPPGYYVFTVRMLATTGETVYSDPVPVYVSDAEKGNIVVNGEFDCGQAPWSLLLQGGAVATFEIDTAAGISSGAAAVVTIDNGGTADWHVELQQPFAVDSGHTYIVSFTAQTTQSSMPIIAWVQMNRDPWSLYSPAISATVEALSDYGPFSFVSPATDHQTLLRFNLGNYGGTIVWLDNIRVIDVNLTGLEDGKPLVTDGAPSKSLLSQNYPNPFNPGTTIQYRLPEEGAVSLVLYNPRGQAVRTLVQENQKPGDHSVQWNGENEAGLRVPSGVYVYRLRAETADRTYTVSRKIMMIE
jgi:hypothetical protein